MRFFQKFLLWTIVISAVIVISAYIFNVAYIFKAIRVTYLNGQTTAFLSDFKYFDNHTVSIGQPQPWSVSSEYNKTPFPDSLKNFHEELGSVAYLIIHQDSIWLEQYFDDYSKNSKSNSFSMAKSIVSAILGKVIEEGKIQSLDQKIIDFVPELKGTYAKDVTFHDVVTMSSGMYWDEKYYSPFSVTTRAYFDKDLQRVIASLPVDSQPGQSFKYQSGDTQLLGIAIQRATSSTLSNLLSKYFWKPMGAEQEALWQVDSKENGIEKAYCCLASNARDFARFGKLYLNLGNWNGQQLLSEEYVKKSLEPRFENAPQYGYSWWLGTFKEKNYFYMDGHLGQYVIVIPSDDLIIVRLGHHMEQENRMKSDPQSAFYKLIDHAYQLLKKRDVSYSNP